MGRWCRVAFNIASGGFVSNLVSRRLYMTCEASASVVIAVLKSGYITQANPLPLHPLLPLHTYAWTLEAEEESDIFASVKRIGLMTSALCLIRTRSCYSSRYSFRTSGPTRYSSVWIVSGSGVESNQSPLYLDIGLRLRQKRRTSNMSLRLPISLTQVLRHTITPPKQTLPSRFFSSQPVYRSPQPCFSSVARRPIPLSLQVPRSTSKPTGSFSFLRSFSTTRQNMMRPNYFPRSGRSGGPAPKAGFFRRLLIRLESYPHTYIVSPHPFITNLSDRN